jgi:hypothetical protein
MRTTPLLAVPPARPAAAGCGSCSSGSSGASIHARVSTARKAATPAPVSVGPRKQPLGLAPSRDGDNGPKPPVPAGPHRHPRRSARVWPHPLTSRQH